MQIKHFIGIDVSKDTLDLSIVVQGKCLQHLCIKNRAMEIKSAINKIMKSFVATVDDTIFCMEHTGMYNLPLVKYLQSQQSQGSKLLSKPFVEIILYQFCLYTRNYT